MGTEGRREPWDMYTPLLVDIRLQIEAEKIQNLRAAGKLHVFPPGRRTDAHSCLTELAPECWYTEIHSRQDSTHRSSGNKFCWNFARDGEMYARFQVGGPACGIQEIRDKVGVFLSDAICYDGPAAA